MIKIKSIQLENFKCFGALPKLEFGKLTLITGANSAGKSSLMYSILSLLQSENFPFQFTANGRYVEMGSFLDMVYNHDDSKDAVISVVLDKDGIIYEINTTLSNPEQGTQPIVTKFVCNADYFNIILTRYSYSQNFSYKMDLRYDSTLNELAKSRSETFVANFSELASKQNVGSDKMEEILKVLHSWVAAVDVKGVDVLYKDNGLSCKDNNTSFAMSMVLSDVADLLKQLNLNLNFVTSFRSPAKRTYLETTLKDGKLASSGEGFVMELLNWRDNDRNKYEGIIDQLRSLGILYDIEPKRLDGGNFQVGIKVIKDSVLSNLSDVGFGVSQVLPVIVADMELGDGSTLLAAQPEIHLHPSVQANLGNYFVNSINSSNKSYIIETHSEYLLNRLRLEIVKGHLKSEDVKVYFINRKDGEANIHDVKFCKNGQVIGAPDDFFETYMMDVMNIAMEAE